MEIEIEYLESVGKTAENKYLLRNKFKSKLVGLESALSQTKQKLENISKDISVDKGNIKISRKIDRVKHWYSKFRWFFTKNGFLVIAGRDAKNNELLIKRYMEKNDFYFHAEIHGAPHTLLKTNNKEPLEIDKIQAASFAMINSSAWKNKVYSTEVYSVKPEQVTKTANPGESLGTGAFVIRGQREYYKKLNLKLKVVYDKEKGLYACPILLIEKEGKEDVVVVPGKDSKSVTSKKIKEIFSKKGISLAQEEIDSVLPPGNFDIL